MTAGELKEFLKLIPEDTEVAVNTTGYYIDDRQANHVEIGAFGDDMAAQEIVRISCVGGAFNLAGTVLVARVR
jgi:hypothetical protein